MSGAKRKPITVVIADDHPLVRQGIAAFLGSQRDLSVVGEAADAPGAIALCAAHGPDVAILDMVMPEGGVEAVRAVRAASPGTRVVVLTSYDDGAVALRAIQAGATAYLLKDVAPEALADAIRRAARDEATLHPRVASGVTEALRAAAAVSELLTAREREVLALIAEGLDNRRIAARLGIAEKTVKVHVGNLLAKLNLADRTQAAVLAWRRGWVGAAPDAKV